MVKRKRDNVLQKEVVKDVYKAEAKVIQAFPNSLFLVELLENGYRLKAYLSGKLKIFYIKIVPNDIVVVEISKYNPDKGRIIYRV